MPTNDVHEMANGGFDLSWWIQGSKDQDTGKWMENNVHTKYGSLPMIVYLEGKFIKKLLTPQKTL